MISIAPKVVLPGLAIVILAMAGCNRNQDCDQQYVPVEIVVGRDPGLVDRPDWLTAEHVEKMKMVLRCYNEPCKVANGTLWISARLKADRELLANYTQKARE